MRQLSTRESQDRAWNGVCWWWISWPWGWYQHAARCMKYQQRASPVSSLVLLCCNELHTAEYWKRCLSFMEPGDSLPCSEELCAGSCLQPGEASTQIHTLFRICFNSNLGSGIWYGLSCGFPLLKFCLHFLSLLFGMLFQLQDCLYHWHVKHIIPFLYIKPSSWIWTLTFKTCRRRRKLNITLEKVHFVGVYCIIILQCTVQKT